MSDEQFHEFHLDGKQMVFLFMASTVVAVVIFLCGVMVGRGVRANKGVEPLEAAAGLFGDPTASPGVLSAAGRTQTTEAAPSDASASTDTPDDLTYPQRLDGDTPPSETLRGSDSRLATGDASPPVAEEPAATTSRPEPAAARTSQEPAGSGYVVQVMSVPQRAEADAVRQSLVAKGYPSFVSATPDAKPRYRVRVGKYATRKEAEAVAARLEKVEKFRKPWVTH